jgi:hypothetical protein
METCTAIQARREDKMFMTYGIDIHKRHYQFAAKLSFMSSDMSSRSCHDRMLEYNRNVNTCND